MSKPRPVPLSSLSPGSLLGVGGLEAESWSQAVGPNQAPVKQTSRPKDEDADRVAYPMEDREDLRRTP